MNTSDFAASLPRDAWGDRSREQVICRLPGNESIVPNTILAGFAKQAIWQAAKNGRTAVPTPDQTKISDGFECPAVSCRVGDRAVPIHFRVKQTEGAMGFDGQEPLLDDLAAVIPDDARILLAADRFYGHPKLIGYHQKKGWQYRVQLKRNPALRHQGGEMSVGELLELEPQGIEDANLCGTAS